MSCKEVDHCMNWVWNEGNEKKKTGSFGFCFPNTL